MLLNYDKTVTLLSRYPPKEVMRRLVNEIRPKKWYDASISQEFKGEVFANGFHLRQIRRTTLLIQGTITDFGSGQSMVKLRYTNTTADKSIYFTVIGLITLLILVFSLGSGFHKSFWPFIIFMLVPTLLITGIGNLNWAIASSRSTMRLKVLLAAKEIV